MPVATSQSPFRRDIEGLRGLAILSVLLFHLGIPAFSGGYVGVDVFYVISGYLITTKIDADVRNGSFSFRDFYIRRMRRIFPAAFTTIAISFAAAAILFPPMYLEQVGGEAMSATFGVANIYYWMQSGYFNPVSIHKPLLHMWSLGVEEQFYLFWPLLVLLLSRLRPGLRLPILGAITLASLAACIYVLRLYPEAAFFLTPFRVFEFSIGAAIPLLGSRTPPLARATFHAAGLALIALPVFLYTDETSFPGINALPPVLGAAFIIGDNAHGRITRLLDNGALRWLGRISYSLYLVHWPLVVFASHIHGDLDPPTLQALVLVLSLLAAQGLHRLVETRFRVSGPATASISRRLALGCLASVALLILAAASAWASGGWKWRAPAELRALNETSKAEYDAYLFSHNSAYAGTPFNTARPNVLIVGDSQASDLLNIMVESGLDQVANIRILPIETRCAPLIVRPEERDRFWGTVNPRTAHAPEVARNCRATVQGFENDPNLQAADVIFLANLWQKFQLPYLGETLHSLEARTRADIVVVARKAQKMGSIELANNVGRLDGIEQFAAHHNQWPLTRAINTGLQGIAGPRFMAMAPYLCQDADDCYVVTDTGKPVFYDLTHLSRDGARFLGARMKADLLRKMFPHTICGDDLSFDDEHAWHACEKDGRWLKDMDATLRVRGVKGARALVLTGQFFAVSRKVTAVVDGTPVDAGVDIHDGLGTTISIPLPTPNARDELTLKLSFNGPPAVSPASVGPSADSRLLNFYLQDLKVVR